MTGPSSAADKAQWVCERARAIGFDLCGVAPVALEEAESRSGANRSHRTTGCFPELARLPEWLASGYAGEMKYLRDSRRRDPRLVLEGARSLIVVALNYNSAPPYSTKHTDGSGRPYPADSGDSHDDLPRGWISRYAWGDDYHTVLREKLDTLLAAMRAQFPEPFEARAYVDTGPIIERVAAKYAGLGWLAKNTCLINQQLGSWLFLGVIITTLAIEPTLAPAQPPAPDLCGTCTRCLDACPTQAFPAPYVLDSRRCISYLTIELRGAIPEELREPMGSALIGCDICQDVCPWNRKAPVTLLSAFAPRQIAHTANLPSDMDQADARAGTSQAPALPGESSAVPGIFPEPDMPRPLSAAGDSTPFAQLDIHSTPDPQPEPTIAPIPIDHVDLSLLAPGLEWAASLSQSEFSEIFRRSAAKRTKWRGLVRNACVALGNSAIARDSESYSRIMRLLETLACSDDPLICEHARWAFSRLAERSTSQNGPSPDGRAVPFQRYVD